MSRHCGICTHPRRLEFERRVINGSESLRLIARDTGYSEAALQRHSANHLAPSLRGEMRARGLSITSFAERLANLADVSADVREHALLTNNPTVVLRSIDTETRTLIALLDRLGIESTDTLEVMTSARTFVLACQTVLAKHPGALEELSELLDGEPDLLPLIPVKSPRELTA